MIDARLTAENVERVFIACLGSRTDLEDGMIKVRGITFSACLKKDALGCHTDEITAMLEELPHQFHEREGGGYSMLHAYQNKDGKVWGKHPHVEQLIILGIGIGRVKFSLPRETWLALPGGLPYVTVTTKQQQQMENQ